MQHARPFVPVAVAAVLVAAAGCSAAPEAPAGAAAKPSESGGEVADAKGAAITLEATGKKTAIINFSFGDQTGQKSEAKLPWTMKGQHTGDEAATYGVYVTAGESGGPVACRILVNGKPAKTGKGEGQFASADCTLGGWEIK